MRDHERIRLSHKRLARALAVLSVPASCLVFSAPPAFAAPPEKPVTLAAESVTGTSATLNGELNPTTEATDGYEFTYNSNGTCEGSATEPSAEAEGKAIKVSTEVAGLVPSTDYTFCVVARHTEGEVTESTSGVPLTFKTLAVRPTVESQSFFLPFFGDVQTEATLEAQINPNNQATTCKFEYGTSEALGTSVPCEPPTLEGFPGQHASANLAGLNPNTVYYYRVAAESAAGKAENVPIQELRTEPPLPTATTGEASMVTPTSATITGTVNPGSSGPNSEASYFFEYSQSKTPTSFEECVEPSCFAVPPRPGGNVGQGTTDVSEAAQLPVPGSIPEQPPLKPHESYHYRIVARNNGNGFSKAAYGADAEFTTPALAPIAAADLPANLSSNSATLTGSVNPEGVPGNYHFEYGTTTAYGTSLPEVAVAATESGLGVSANIAGLAPNTTYHVRIVVSNNGGATVTESLDQTFTTYASEAASSGPLPPGFSLTGTAPAGPAAITFPNLTGLAPTPPPPAKPTGGPKPLTAAEKLSAALRACKKAKEKQKKQKCEREARKKYKTKAKKKK